MTNFSFKTVMKYRNFFYGLAAVWIVFFHIHDMLRVPESGALMRFLHLGNIGVDIFLFLSAVGLSYSIEKNSLKEFYKNRILRLWIPFLIICVPYYMWRDSVTGITLERVQCFLLDISAINFWLKEKVPFWYVSLATVLYALYPLFYKLYRKNKNYIPIIIAVFVIAEVLLMENGIFTHTEKALSRVPIFLIGIWLSDVIKENREITKKHLVISAVIFTVSLVVYLIIDPIVYVMYKRFVYAVMTVPMLILLAYAMEKINEMKFYSWLYSFFCFFGGISLELYLVHNAITRILKYYDLRHYPAYTYYLWIFPVSVVLALMYNHLADKAVKKLNKGK